MLFKHKDQKVSERQNMRGGDGTVIFNELLPVELLNNKGRLLSSITLEPGCSIGFHEHTGEIEIYYMLEGVLTYNENNEKEYVIEQGDCVINPDNTGHAVKNNGNEKAVILALILFT